MLFTWLGILLCLVHSAMFSGMNLAVFSISRLQFELRQDSDLALTTILWGQRRDQRADDTTDIFGRLMRGISIQELPKSV